MILPNCCSMAVDPALTSCPKYYMSKLRCFFIIHNFTFHFLHCCFLSLINGTTPVSCHNSVGSGCAFSTDDPGSVTKEAALPWITKSTMVMKTIKCNLFLKSLHLFLFFFLYSHLRMRAYLISLRKVSAICFVFSRLSSNTDDAWHFEVQGFPSTAFKFIFWVTLTGLTGNW
jgi:hypothetical protein